VFRIFLHQKHSSRLFLSLRAITNIFIQNRQILPLFNPVDYYLAQEYRTELLVCKIRVFFLLLSRFPLQELDVLIQL
jgi:hypothetical protein